MSVLHSDLQYTGSDGQVLTLGVKAWLWGEELDTATWELRRLGEALFPAWGSADNKAFEGRFNTLQGGIRSLRNDPGQSETVKQVPPRRETI